MQSTDIVHGEGIVVAQPHTGRLFVTGEDGISALDENLRDLVKPGDEMRYEAIFGDQFATPLALNGRGLS